MLEPPENEPIDDEVVPLFGTWRNIYLAVLLCAVGWIAFVAVFSRWPF